MTISKSHRILVATDGSPSAQAALQTAIAFPWAESACVRAVVASAEWPHLASEAARAAVAQNYEQAADAAREALSRRWNSPEVRIVEQAPAEAILGEALDFDATVIVLGWRGHGGFHRLLAGSVSRAVASQARCPVLVVREAMPAVRRFVVGYDGCENAQRAVEFLCSLAAGPDGHVVLVNVIEPLSAPATVHLLPAGARGIIHRELREFNEERSREARAALGTAQERLTQCGWSVAAELRTGAPLERLLSATEEHLADALVVGVRAVGGVERALLGSVANGALNRARVPVLIVR